MKTGKILKFLAIFIICFGVFNYFYSGNAFGFFRLGIWTSEQNAKLGSDYIRKTSVDDSSLGTLLANIQLGYSNYSDSYHLVKGVESFDTTASLINTDVIELFDGGVNKAALLQSYLNQVELELNDIDNLIFDLSDIVSSRESNYVDCESQKEQGDEEFFQGVNLGDKSLVLDGLNNSIVSGPCSTEERIWVNANNVVLQKLEYYKNILNDKYNLVTSNTDVILQNIDMFSEDLLEQLLYLNQKLKAYSVE